MTNGSAWQNRHSCAVTETAVCPSEATYSLASLSAVASSLVMTSKWSMRPEAFTQVSNTLTVDMRTLISKDSYLNSRTASARQAPRVARHRPRAPPRQSIQADGLGCPEIRLTSGRSDCDGEIPEWDGAGGAVLCVPHRLWRHEGKTDPIHLSRAWRQRCDRCRCSATDGRLCVSDRP